MKPESIEKQIEAEAKSYAITEWAMESKSEDGWIAITKSYIAGRSKGIEEAKKKDERIKELEDGLYGLINLIETIRDDAEEWATYRKAKQLLK